MLKRFKFILLFASLSISLCLMSNTYSRYVADTTGNVDVLFAKWQILVSDTDITNNSNSTISFVPIIEPNENVKANTMAPSSKGYYDINIDPTNVEVSFKYDITLAITNENMPDLMITKYSILPENYVEGQELTSVDIENNLITDTLYFDNTTPEFKFKPITIRVYFEWFEGTSGEMTEQMNDEADTTVGLTAAIEGATFTVNAAIHFEQVIETPTIETEPTSIVVEDSVVTEEPIVTQ